MEKEKMPGKNSKKNSPIDLGKGTKPNFTELPMIHRVTRKQEWPQNKGKKLKSKSKQNYESLQILAVVKRFSSSNCEVHIKSWFLSVAYSTLTTFFYYLIKLHEYWGKKFPPTCFFIQNERITFFFFYFFKQLSSVPGPNLRRRRKSCLYLTGSCWLPLKWFDNSFSLRCLLACCSYLVVEFPLIGSITAWLSDRGSQGRRERGKIKEIGNWISRSKRSPKAQPVFPLRSEIKPTVDWKTWLPSYVFD